MVNRKARDVQKMKVYEFEEELAELYDIHDEQLTLFQCQELVTRICSEHAVHPPEVMDGRGRKNACADTLWIRLPKQFRNLIGVIHETCHVVCNSIDGADSLPDHSPLFVRYFIEIFLTRFPKSSRDSVENYATICNVEVAPVDRFKALPPECCKKLLQLFIEVDWRNKDQAQLEAQLEASREELEAAEENVDSLVSSAREKFLQ